MAVVKSGGRAARRVAGLAVVACVVLGCRGPGGFAEERRAAVDARDLPEPVAQAWRTRHPGAELRSARAAVPQDAAPGAFVLTLERDGREFQLVVDGSGRLLAVREPLGVGAVPPAVDAAVRERWPAARIVHAQREVRDPHGASVELVRVRVAEDGAERWEVFHGNGRPWRAPATP